MNRIRRSSKKASQQVELFLRLFGLSGQECECMKILTRSNIAYSKRFDQNLVSLALTATARLSNPRSSQALRLRVPLQDVVTKLQE